jgi:hypothetical protein
VWKTHHGISKLSARLSHKISRKGCKSAATREGDVTSLNNGIAMQEHNSEVTNGSGEKFVPENYGSIPGGVSISTRVVQFPEPVGVSSAGAVSPSPKRGLGKKHMKDKGDLGTVPDSSMLPLFKSLVGFMIEESQARGWDDVKTRLQAVESALTSRKESKTGTR